MLSINDKVELSRACENAYRELQVLSGLVQRFVNPRAAASDKAEWKGSMQKLAADIEDLYMISLSIEHPATSLIITKESQDIHNAAEAAEDAFNDLKLYSAFVDQERPFVKNEVTWKVFNEVLNNHIAAVKEPFEKLELKYIPNELEAE